MSRKKKQNHRSRPRPPAIHITQLVEENGETYEQGVSSPVCDFCFDQGPRWDYPCARFHIAELGFGSDEGWSACDACSALIEAADVQGIVERGLLVFGQPERRQALTQITEGFFAHRSGARIPFG